MALRHGERDLGETLDRLARPLNVARYGLDQFGEGVPPFRLAEHFAPVTAGPHSQAVVATERIEQAEARNA